MKHWLAMLAIVVGSGFVTATSQAQSSDSYFYLVHAASGRNYSSTANPELPLDISVNGKCRVAGVSYGEILGPYVVAAGAFNFKVSLADSTKPCSNAAIFSGSSSVFAADTYAAVISLDASNAFTGQVYSLDLSSLPAGSARAFVINSTAQGLGATVTYTPTTDGSGGLFSVPAGMLRVASPPLGVTYTSIYSNQTTLEAGPVQIQTLSRDAYIYVFAGSTTNGTVQLIGPKAIRGLF